MNKPVWIRQVIVPDVNDSEAELSLLASLLLPYRAIIEKVELLPFKKLCLEKYDALGIEFPLREKKETEQAVYERLQNYINSLL